MQRIRYWLARAGINRIWSAFEARISGQLEYLWGVPAALRNHLLDEWPSYGSRSPGDRPS